MQLLDYLLTEKLGEGGVGTVYRAQDRRQGRTVAVKVTHARHSGNALLQLEREAHSLSLRHPNILSVERFAPLGDGRLLLVMPLLEGKTLEKWLVPLSWRRALDIARQTASGLAYAHKQGVLHCDVKPANLMLVKGHLSILDFGLSRLLEDPTEGITGTLEYMSPEAARGQQLTPQSDLWSLGVLLYELLTGRSPFASANVAQTLRNIAEAEPAPVHQVRPGLPVGVDRMMQRLLSKDAQLRYPDADALLDDLTALAAGSQPAPLPLTSAARPDAPPLQVTRVLPDKPAPLVGREDECALLSLYLSDPECRLLTLQGLGGVGKTHLGLWVSHELTGFTHVHGAELFNTPSGGFIATLANTLGAEGSGLEALKRTIAGRKQLLVLDNFEHLTAQAWVLETLLGACSQLVFLVTSRARLGLDAEWVVPLRGLSFPALLPSPDEAGGYAATAFFAQKARAVNPAFDLSRDLPSVYRICLRLQGHPLALSLAAALLAQQPIEAVAAQLEQSFTALGRGEGRQGIQTVFTQSYRLLAPAQQQLLRTLTLFRGGFETAAIAAVTGTDVRSVTEALGELMDRSLLERSLEGRYLQHPVILQSGREVLPAPDAAAQMRYRDYYLTELRCVDQALTGTGRKKALQVLEHEAANFSSALVAEELLPELGEPLRVFYTHQGRYHEGLELFGAQEGPFAQACAGWFALLLGDLERAYTNAAEVLNANRDDDRVCLVALNTQAGVLARQNHLMEARTLSLEALALARRRADQPMLSAVLTNLALLEEFLGNQPQAAEYYQQSLELSETHQDYPQLLVSLNNLACLYLYRGLVGDAKTLLERGLVLSDRHRLTRMRPQLRLNFGFCLYLAKDYENAEEAYLEAYQTLLGREDKTTIVTARAYLGQNYGASGHIEKAYRWLYDALAQAQREDDHEGSLCALVRFAELLLREGHTPGKALAAMVRDHTFTEPADRQLAERLAQGEASHLSLGATAQALRGAPTLAALVHTLQIVQKDSNPQNN